MPETKVVVIGRNFMLSDEASAILAREGARVVHVDSEDPDRLVAVCRDADALLVVLTAIRAQVIDRLDRCRAIVRMGVGYDNMDLEAARARGIPICNVPDYCTNEVADHTLSIALTLVRALAVLDHSVRSDVWHPVLPYPIQALETLTFGVIGFGRIGRAALERARAFKFRCAACDPYVADAEFEAAGVQRRGLDELLAEADILSLHTPLTPETRHLIDAARLAQMKRSAILINTARGQVVDTLALADALQRRTIAAAGVDVFEAEPLPIDHPLRACQNVILTPHYAWHSELSKRKRDILAAEEVARALRGEPLRCCVNGVA